MQCFHIVSMNYSHWHGSCLWIMARQEYVGIALLASKVRAGCKGTAILRGRNHINALICGALWPVTDCVWDLALPGGTK